MCIDCDIECKCSCPSEELVFNAEKGIHCYTCLHHVSTPRKRATFTGLDGFIAAFRDVNEMDEVHPNYRYRIHWICETESREETETISHPTEFNGTVLVSHIFSFHKIALVEVTPDYEGQA